MTQVKSGLDSWLLSYVVGSEVASSQRPEQIARELWLAFHARAWEIVGSLLHPDAQLQTALAEAPLSASEALSLWRSEVGPSRFNPRPLGFVELDDQRVLVIGVLRSAAGEGKADALVLTFKNNLLWRTRYYDSAEEAQDSPSP